MLAVQREALAIRKRLLNPPNAVRDDGIDLKRIPIMKIAAYGNDVFGPIIPTPDDRAFGPVVAPYQKRPKITVLLIQKAVCSHYGISQMDIVSARRQRAIVRARQVAMYLCRTLTPRSYPEIGRLFGGKDHSTVMHAVRRIEELKKSEVFASDIESLVAQFE